MKCALHRAAFPDSGNPVPDAEYVVAGWSVCDICRRNLVRGRNVVPAEIVAMVLNLSVGIE